MAATAVAGCLPGQQGFKNFDEEAARDSNSAVIKDVHEMPAPKRQGTLAIALGGAGLLLGLVALALSIYAAVTANNVGKKMPSINSAYLGQGANGGAALIVGPTGNAALISSSAGPAPAGYQLAGHLFEGTGYFARLSPMLYSRSDHRAKPVGDDVYLIGGMSSQNDLLHGGNNASADNQKVLLNQLVRYATYTEHSVELRPMPEPRSRHAAVVLGDEIYVIGGVNTLADDPPRPLPSAVLKYSIKTGNWTVLPGGLNTPRSDCCAEVIGNRIYVTGGYDKEYNTLASTEVYDPATGLWTFVASMPTARGDCEAVAMSRDCMLVLGGWNMEKSFLNVAECYDPITDSWSPRASMNMERGDFAAEVLPGGRVIVMGGEGNRGNPEYNNYATHSVEMYIPGDNVWIPKAPLPEARFRFDTAHVGEHVYVFGGHPTCSDSPDAVVANGRLPCVSVGLNTTWGFFDTNHPNAYIYTKGA